MNNRFQNAARKLPGRAASGIRGGVRRAAAGMRGWQKAGLILCILFWILSAVIGYFCDRVTGKMADQNFAERWSPDGGNAQISTFLSDDAGISDDTVKALYSYFYTNLNNDSISLSETQVENGASLIDYCYCGIGNVEIGADEESLTVTAIGVGGDFFNFHPLELLDGFYFSQDDLMQDRVLMDDETAWRLFGSPEITGKSIQIGGVPHYVAGVFHRPDKRFYNVSGMGDYLIFLSYDSFCRYAEAGGSPSGGESDPDGSSFPEGTAGHGTEIQMAEMLPTTAAWVPAADFVPDPGSAKPDTAEKEPDPGPGNGPETLRRAGQDGAVLSALSEGEDEGDGVGDSDGGDSGDPLTEDADSSLRGDEREDTSNADGWTGEPGDGEEPAQKEEINRNRISCYEVILPNPISEYALRMVRSALTEMSVDMEQASVIENSSRFDVFRLALMIAEPGVRSMQTAPIRYPYWENVALAWEDVLVPFAMLRLFLRYSPFLFLFYLLLWYATHKSWTLGGIAGTIRDRIYDRQSERIYGKRPAGELPMEGGPPGTDAAEDSAESGSADSAGQAAPQEDPHIDSQAQENDV
ncbi:MAG: ABC transporter permease [Eubacteriales bacterium]|nr:ABC transporter permease [Eubacteriales bacterium]